MLTDMDTVEILIRLYVHYTSLSHSLKVLIFLNTKKKKAYFYFAYILVKNGMKWSQKCPITNI